MRRIVGLFVVALLAGCLGDPSDDPAPSPSPGPVTFAGAVLHTEMGDVTWVFYLDAAPETTAHITQLLREGYYDGKSFGRVVPGHVIQQVERDGGTVTDDARRVPLETSPAHHFSAGAVGIARSADPGSGGPEFFVMDYATSHLDGNYTVFAQVVDGLDVVHRIARVTAVTLPSQAQLLTDRVAIDPVTIVTADLVDVDLAGEQAARLPGQVARNLRTGDFRHSLEWPADLAPGIVSELTWYVRPYNETPSIDPSRLALTIAGSATPLRPESGLPEILHFGWAPPVAGAHAATLHLDGKEWATLTIHVPSTA